MTTDVRGTFNVAGDGVLLLSQALRCLHRPTVPLPGFAVGGLGSLLRQARAADFSPEQLGFLTYGRGVDTTRMRSVLGFEPAFSTASAFEDFGREMSPSPGVREKVIDGLSAAPPGGRPWVTPRSSHRHPRPTGSGHRQGPAVLRGPQPRGSTGRASPRARGRPRGGPADSGPRARPGPQAAAAAQDPPDHGRSRRRRRARRPPPRTAAPLRGSLSGDGPAAIETAAVEVFGDEWEPALARFLAFLRRRVTGEYAIDEYGFDAEITDRFVMAALRPIAQKWFRIDVRGIENIPVDGGRPRGVQPLGHRAGRRADDDVGHLRPHRSAPASARRRPGLQDAARSA